MGDVEELESKIQELEEKQDENHNELVKEIANMKRFMAPGDMNRETNNTRTMDDNRPQTNTELNNDLSIDNQHFRDLSNHELHRIKSSHSKKYETDNKTIFDESVNNVIDKTVNFLSYSYDKYEKSYLDADELIEYENMGTRTYSEIMKTHLLAISLFLREKDVTIYLGIIFIFISFIISLFSNMFV